MRGLDDFIRWFDTAGALEGSLAGFAPIIEIHIERLVAQGVGYAELMIGTSELPPPPSAIDELTAFRSWLDARCAGRIRIELLVALNRVRPAEWLARFADDYAPLFAAGLIAGVNVAGWPEQGHPASRFRDGLARLRDHGAGIAVHAGEWAPAASVWDAIEAGAQRIGHGVTAFDDERLVDAIAERGIHIEMCPTSNLKTGAIARIEDHPIAKARDRGVSFSINTDDPGPFECSVASEHALVRRVFGFDDDDFTHIAAASYAARFAR